jgi:hypothetical protein
VFSGGAGIRELNARLREPPAEAPRHPVGFQAAPKTLHRVPEQALTGAGMRKLRRAGRLTRMAARALECVLEDSNLDGSFPGETGLILATGLGAHADTFAYQDSLLDFGEKEPSPARFSHSVHNACASYLSNRFSIQGPCLTVTHPFAAFEQALFTAGCWLEQGTCGALLLGAADEYGDVAGYLFDRLCDWPDSGVPDPFAPNETRAVPGEGAVFFLLEKTDRPRFGFLSLPEAFPPTQREKNLLRVLTRNPPPRGAPGSSASLSGGARLDFTALFGSMMPLGAFQCAAVLSLFESNAPVHPAWCSDPRLAARSFDRALHLNLLDPKHPGRIRLSRFPKDAPLSHEKGTAS